MWGLAKTVTKTYLKTAVKTFKLSAFVVGVYTAGREFGRSEERETVENNLPPEIVYQWCGSSYPHGIHDTRKGQHVVTTIRTKMGIPVEYRCPGADKSGIRRIKKEQ